MSETGEVPKRKGLKQEISRGVAIALIAAGLKASTQTPTQGPKAEQTKTEQIVGQQSPESEQNSTHIIRRAELESRYNTTIHDLETVRLDVGRGATETRTFQQLETGRFDLRIILVNGVDVDPTHLTTEQREAVPQSIINGVQRKIDEAAVAENTVIGTTITEGGLQLENRRIPPTSWVFIAVAGQSAAHPSQSFPDTSTLQIDEDDPEYHIQSGWTPGIVLRHELLHAQGILHPETDRLLIANIADAHTQHESGNDAGYWLVFKTPEGNVYT